MSFSFVFGGIQGEISFMRFFQLMSLKKRCSLISLIPFLAPMRFLGSLKSNLKSKSLASGFI